MKLPRIKKRHCPGRVRGADQSGSILVIVLWISFGLVAITLMFGHSMFMEFRASDNRAAGIQAEQAIEGAARYARFLLSDLEEQGVLPDIETYQAGELTIGQATVWFVGRDPTEGRLNEPYFALVDEASRLNLNAATVEMLEALPRMTPEFAAAIVDWRDENEEITSGGAESETYHMRVPAYECKNADFETIDELKWVAGATDEILYGEDTNRNGLLDWNENDGSLNPPMDNQDGILDPGILEYVTVYTREPEQEGGGGGGGGGGQQQSGRGLVNVNSASSVVLTCLPGMEPAKADQIIAYREANDYPTDLNWLAEVIGGDVAGSISRFLTTKSYQVTADIAAVGKNGRGFRRVRFVFDLTEEAPKIVYRQDLSPLGWALGSQVVQQLSQSESNRR